VPVNYTPKPIKADVTFPVRAVNTQYQNLRLRPLLVIVATTLITWAPGVDTARLTALVGAVPPLAAVDTVAHVGNVGAIDHIHNATLTFIVPPGWYYYALEFLAGGGTNVVLSWTEVEL